MELPATPASVSSYDELRHEYHRLLQQKAEAATLEKVRRGNAVGRLPLGYEYGPDGAAQVDPSRERLLREAFLLAAECLQLWRILTNPFYVRTVAA